MTKAKDETTCACGCGIVIRHGTKYVPGHWSRTPEGRAKAAEAGRARQQQAAQERRDKEALMSTGIDAAEAEAMVRTLRVRTHDEVRALAGPLVAPSESEQANLKPVSERWSEDDIVTMMQFVGVETFRITKMIDLMDFIGKVKRGES